MATNVKYYCMGFLADGTPSVRTFADRKPIEKNDTEYINDLKEQVQSMADDNELVAVEIITAAEYNLYINGDGENNYVRDMASGKPIVYIPPEPTKEEKQIVQVNSIAADTNSEAQALKDAMLTAILTGDTQLQTELKEEYQTLIANSNSQLQEVIEND